MILVDANLLLHAKFSDLPQHPRVRAWLEGKLNSPGRVGIPWESSLAFLRLIRKTCIRRESLPTTTPNWEPAI
jgi:uncharacterized protein